MKVLVTGFGPFDKTPCNPSEVLVRNLGSLVPEGIELVTEVLDVVYASAGRRVEELVRQLRPDGVLLTGLCSGGSVIYIERAALNVESSSTPDNAGDVAAWRPVSDGGPPAFLTPSGLEELRDALRAKGIPCYLSSSAGTFLCNQVYYRARLALADAGLPRVPCLFVHVALFPEQAAKMKDPTPSMDLYLQRRALVLVLEWMRGDATGSGVDATA